MMYYGKHFCTMDETSRPYEKNEKEIIQTQDDIDFEKEIIKKYNLEVKEDYKG